MNNLNIKYLLLLTFFTLIIWPSLAQYRILIHVQQDISDLRIKDARTGIVTTIPVWNKSGNGYLIETNNLSRSIIQARQTNTFHLYNLSTKESTQWIVLQKNEEISMKECFNEHLAGQYGKTSFLQRSSRLFNQTLGGFLLSSNTIFSKNKLAPLRFHKSNKHYFINKQDIKICWDAEYAIKSISIMEDRHDYLIWNSTGYKKNCLTYQDLQQNLSEPLKSKIIYKILIELDSPDPENFFYYQFSIVPFTFITSNPAYFIYKDSVEIKWETQKNIKKIFIKDVTDKGKVIWKKNNYKKDFVNYDLLKNQLQEPFQARHKYQLVVELKEEKEKQYILDFEILLNDKEFEKLMEFLNSDDQD